MKLFVHNYANATYSDLHGAEPALHHPLPRNSDHSSKIGTFICG